MLRSVKKCKEYTLAARDGKIGHLRELYFDDTHWTIRWAVAQAGNWLTGRLVLISPRSFGKIDDEAKTISVDLTREQIRNSPSPETDQPVSRQFEVDYYTYFGWPYYWVGPYLWGPSPYPVMPPEASDLIGAITHAGEHRRGDPHLRSTDEIGGYHIRAKDGEIGHVDDFLFSDSDWALHYVCASTRNWLPGKHVVFPPSWIKGIKWEDSQIAVDTLREDVRQAPGYEPGHAVDDDLEKRLASYYESELRNV